MAQYVNIPIDRLTYLFTSFNKQGANLGNADVTVQPFTDLGGVSLYTMPPNTMTANRAVTLGNTSAPPAGVVWLCFILRQDQTANTLTVKRADTTNIYVDPVSPTQNRILQFICSNGVWSANAGYICP